MAAYWYAVYRRSDWAALRAHGAEVFLNRVTEAEAERVRRSGRCIVIDTPDVKAEEIDSPTPRGRVAAPIAARAAGQSGEGEQAGEDVMTMACPGDKGKIAEPAVQRLIEITRSRQKTTRAVLDWLKVEFEIVKPTFKLQSPAISMPTPWSPRCARPAADPTPSQPPG
jgi:hypothetical protein